ncbi:translation initiation factor IF-2-like [Ursus maritimus]|uniref:Translation initiation factor IF-2-like n=1 Tax=Ursus maritimus TaxID=29073 RepID=A0A8M1GQ87_URSMA|nr:translation initiation factor IF-2-like [Ursus maritimus]
MAWLQTHAESRRRGRSRRRRRLQTRPARPSTRGEFAGGRRGGGRCSPGAAAVAPPPGSPRFPTASRGSGGSPGLPSPSGGGCSVIPREVCSQVGPAFGGQPSSGGVPGRGLQRSLNSLHHLYFLKVSLNADSDLKLETMRNMIEKSKQEEI